MATSLVPIQSPPRHQRSRYALLAGVALALATGASWIALRPTRSAPIVETPEVLRPGLALRDGRWYRTGETNPFTGWLLDAYPNGARLSRASISNGLLNGLCESWFLNGQIQSRECFSNSISNGPRTKWHENGRLHSTATIVAGLMEGVFRRWHENGQLAEEIHMENGKPNGSATAYYASGFVKAETQTSAGRILDRQTWDDGERPGSR